MFKMISFKGAITETYIPWTADFAIDAAALQAQVDYQLSMGIKGLFGIGLTATEKLYLEPGQAEEYVDLLVKFADGRVPVMANVMENSTAKALQVMKSYEASGADALCITQPYGNSLSKDALRRHFETLLEATDKPIGIYNMPPAGYTLAPEFIAELSAKYEHLVYYKNSTQNMVHLQTVMTLIDKPHFEYLEGSDGTILASIAVGGHGVISSISNFLPKLIIDLCDAALAQDMPRAKELNDLVTKVRNINKKVGSGLAHKYLVELLKCSPGGAAKPPLSDISDADKAFLREEYTKLGLL